MVDPKEKNPNDLDVATETTEVATEEIATEETDQAASEEATDPEGE